MVGASSVCRTFLLIIGDLFIAWKLVVGTAGVGQHQMVYPIFMGEVIINAFFLHQTTDEIEVSLPILYAVFASDIAAAKLVLDIGEALVAKHLFDDVGGFFLLEYPAIGGTGQKPQPRPHTGSVIE